MVARRDISIGPQRLPGTLRLPDQVTGTVIFAHGSGSSRLSPRNVRVAESMARSGVATLLFDLLTEDEAAIRRNVFDITLLADRLEEAVHQILGDERLAQLPLGLFGASTGAAAALVAASRLPRLVAAVVSRGGRPDLAGPALAGVKAPTLLLVGSRDPDVLELNREAMRRIGAECVLEIIRGASHLFEEPGTLDSVASHATNWFLRYFAAPGEPRGQPG